MKTAAEILAKEHENILKLIENLSKERDNLEKSKKIEKEFFIKAIEFIRNYADKFHHAKEEDILFKELCKPTSELHCNPVEQMLHEHSLGRDFVKGMEEGLNENNKEKLIENARSYCQLLKEHIFKEDNILYPMAENALSSETKKKMIEKFKKIEIKKKKDKEKALDFLKNLK